MNLEELAKGNCGESARCALHEDDQRGNSTAYCRLARRPVDSMKSVPIEATLLRVEATMMAMACIIMFSETPTSASE